MKNKSLEEHLNLRLLAAESINYHFVKHPKWYAQGYTARKWHNQVCGKLKYTSNKEAVYVSLAYEVSMDWNDISFLKFLKCLTIPKKRKKVSGCI